VKIMADAVTAGLFTREQTGGLILRHAGLLTPMHRALTAVAVILLTPVFSFAQDVTEPALKAAFIYSFAKFTDWPVDAVPVSKPLLMCVVGDDAVGEALEQAVKARMIGGHSLTVSYMAPVPQRECHILYLSGAKANQAGPLVASVRDVPVLTISDGEGFIELGGIVQFYFENGRLRFTIRVQSAKRARLQVSSQLLALARLQ
jgi:hypothetical protein